MSGQVRAAHLLIKHTGSRNPVSRRTGERISTSPEDAMKELQNYEAKIKAEGVHGAFPSMLSSAAIAPVFGTRAIWESLVVVRITFSMVDLPVNNNDKCHSNILTFAVMQVTCNRRLKMQLLR